MKVGHGIVFVILTVLILHGAEALITHCGDINVTNNYGSSNATYNSTDLSLNVTSGTLGVNTSYMQRRVANCSAGESIREIARDGTVVCETDDVGAGGGGGWNETDTSLNLTGTRLGVNTSYMQRRVANCSAGESIREIARDGSVVCETDTDTDTDTQLSQADVWNYMNVSKYFVFLKDYFRSEANLTGLLDDNYAALSHGHATVNTTTNFGGEVSGTYDNIVLGHNALDDQYYDSEGDLTGLLDDNYVSRNNWADIDDYPAACAADHYVTGIGDSLTCVHVVNDTTIPDTNETPRVDALYANATDWNTAYNWGDHSVQGYLTTVSSVNMTTSFGGEVSGTYDNIVLDHNALDDQYFRSKSNLTTLLNPEYANRSDWTTIDNYPAACAAGEAVTGIGDVLSCSDYYDATDDLVDDCTEADACTIDAESMEGTDWGTMSNGEFCTYDLASTEVDCNNAGYLDADGTDDDTPDSDAEVPNDITIDSSGKNHKMDDNDKQYFGTGDDACIYYNGTALVIDGSC